MPTSSDIPSSSTRLPALEFSREESTQVPLGLEHSASQTPPSLGKVTGVWVFCGTLLMLSSVFGCTDWPGRDHRHTPDRDGVPVEAASGARLSEDLRIDGYEKNLVPIRGPRGRIAIAEDGTIAVLQDQDRVVRFFDKDGNSLGDVGGHGQGPGEFIGMSRLGWYADTLWVWDGRQQRITLLSPKRTLVRSFSFPIQAQPAPGEEGLFPVFLELYPEGLHEEGSLYVSLLNPIGYEVAQEFQGHVSLAKVSATGLIETILKKISLGDLSVHGPAGSTMVAFPNPNYRAFSATPPMIATVQAALEGPNSGTFLVSLFDEEGDTLFSRRHPFDPIELPPSVGDSVFSKRMASLSPALAREFRRTVRVPPIYPPLDGALIGNDRTVWVEGIGSSQGRPYWVFNRSGEMVGELLLPSNSRIAVASKDHIWVVETDSLDVESIVRYFVEWS